MRRGTVADVAAHLGVSTAVIHQWKHLEGFPRGEKGAVGEMFDIPAVARWAKRTGRPRRVAVERQP